MKEEKNNPTEKQASQLSVVSGSKWSKKQWILILPNFLLWFLYALVTVNERSQYLKSQERGMDCYSSKDVSRFLYGSVTEFTYDPSSPPVRRYMTWKEFWKYRGYCL